MVKRVYGTAERRFLAYVQPDPSTGCINFACRDPQGYGRFRVDGRMSSAHRFAYERAKGPIPAGLHIDHLCRNRACVNPDHLEAVTPLENFKRGEGVMAVHLRKTHCANGHEFTEANTHRRPGNYRGCRACACLATKRYRAKQLAKKAGASCP